METAMTAIRTANDIKLKTRLFLFIPEPNIIRNRPKLKEQSALRLSTNIRNIYRTSSKKGLSQSAEAIKRSKAELTLLKVKASISLVIFKPILSLQRLPIEPSWIWLSLP